MEKIIQYLKEKYKPESIILYGSYANHTQDLNSDFDALVITKEKCDKYDNAIINDVLLDVFVYHYDELLSNFNPEDFVMIFDGNIIMDNDGIALKLKEKVNQYITNYPKIDNEEAKHLIVWCKKMLERAKREDTEGYYRWHWLLVDTLKIYFDCIGSYYFGPKKSLEILKKKDIRGYMLYQKAVTSFDMKSLIQWIEYLEKIK